MTWGAVSYLQIMDSGLSNKLLAELLELDAEMTVTTHVQTVDQTKEIKIIKGNSFRLGYFCGVKPNKTGFERSLCAAEKLLCSDPFDFEFDE